MMYLKIEKKIGPLELIHFLNLNILDGSWGGNLLSGQAALRTRMCESYSASV